MMMMMTMMMGGDGDSLSMFSYPMWLLKKGERENKECNNDLLLDFVASPVPF